MIKYLGSKRKLIDIIHDNIKLHSTGGVIMDAFSGSGRVSYMLKERGYPVIANDHNAYAHTIATCYIEADTTYETQARILLKELSLVKPQAGYFTDTFCEKSRYIQPKNGAKIDAIREAIEGKDLPIILKCILVTSLIEAADRVDSTVGLQMAYLKKWSKRSHNDLELRLPKLIDGDLRCRALKLEASQAASLFEMDILYLDPPYNQHSYLGNYHIWESLALWDKPEFYGVACKRLDVRERKSPFNSKKRVLVGLKEVVEKSKFNTCIMSYNNEGHLKIEQVVDVLTNYGEVSLLEVDHKRHICSQIGVYDPQGNKVGKAGEKTNKEYLVVCKRGQE
jgi:adenine-specific DNA-methyltransferase